MLLSSVKPHLALNMQLMAKGAQAGFVKRLAPGWMGVNRAGDIFKARAHFHGQSKTRSHL